MDQLNHNVISKYCISCNPCVILKMYGHKTYSLATAQCVYVIHDITRLVMYGKFDQTLVNALHGVLKFETDG